MAVYKWNNKSLRKPFLHNNKVFCAWIRIVSQICSFYTHFVSCCRSWTAYNRGGSWIWWKNREEETLWGWNNWFGGGRRRFWPIPWVLNLVWGLRKALLNELMDKHRVGWLWFPLRAQFMWFELPRLAPRSIGPLVRKSLFLAHVNILPTSMLCNKLFY